MLDYTSIKLSQVAGSFKVQKKPNTFKVTFAKEIGSIAIAGGSLRYFKEDALISGLDGEVWPANRQYFDNSYTPVPPINMGEDGDYQTKPIEVQALVLNEDCQVTMHNGDTLTGKQGDYLVQYPNGDYGIIAAPLFEKLYQKPTTTTPPEKMAGFDIFVSYSTKDKLFTDALIHKLEENKIRCWYAPRDIPIGMEWPQAIAHAIRDAKLMILVFSQYSNMSQEIARELTLASSNKRLVIPVRIDDVMPSDALVYHLSNRHWLDVYGQATDKAVNSVLEGLRKFEAQLPLIQNSESVTTTPEPAATTPPKKSILKRPFIALILAFCLALAGGGYYLVNHNSAIDRTEFNNAMVKVYTGKNNVHINMMYYNSPNEGDLYLLQISNIFGQYNNHIIKCHIEQRNQTSVRFITTWNDGRFAAFILEGDQGTFYTFDHKEIDVKFNEELSAKTTPQQMIKQYREQLRNNKS